MSNEKWVFSKMRLFGCGWTIGNTIDAQDTAAIQARQKNRGDF